MLAQGIQNACEVIKLILDMENQKLSCMKEIDPNFGCLVINRFVEVYIYTRRQSAEGYLTNPSLDGRRKGIPLHIISANSLQYSWCSFKQTHP